MPPVPLLRPEEVIATFKKLGWRVVRSHGSHVILTKIGSLLFQCQITLRSHVARCEALLPVRV
jgi:hypothetical protein